MAGILTVPTLKCISLYSHSVVCVIRMRQEGSKVEKYQMSVLTDTLGIWDFLQSVKVCNIYCDFIDMQQAVLEMSHCVLNTYCFWYPVTCKDYFFKDLKSKIMTLKM
jgi:hypothetical protein